MSALTDHVHYRNPDSYNAAAMGWGDTLCGIPRETFWESKGHCPTFWTFAKENVTCPFCRELIQPEDENLP